MMAASLQATKKALRKVLKDKINQLTEREKVIQSQIVTEKLLNSPQYKSSQRISLFLSMKDEILTNSIMEDIFASKKDCFIPQYSSEEMKMVRLLSLEDYDSLPETKWKIKQPDLKDVRENAIETGGLDLILMPGLGFTTHGFRLGRGRGYYDNYLKLCEKKGHNPVTIALSFSVQILDTIPMSKDDMPVNIVLYPEELDIQKALNESDK